MAQNMDRKSILEEEKYYVVKSNSGTEYISLVDVIGTLRSNLKVVIYTTASFFLLSLLYAFLIADTIYVSRSSFLPTSGDEGISDIGNLASRFGLNIPGSTGESAFSSQDMYLKILQSRTLSETLLDSTFNTQKYGQQKSLLQILTYGNDDPEYGIDTLREKAIAQLREEIISTSGDDNTTLITLSVSTFEPELSVELNNLILRELEKLQKQFKMKQVLEKKRFIEDRVITVGNELEDLEEKLMNFRIQNRQIMNSPTLMLQQERFSRDIAVQTGVYTTLLQQLEMTKIEAVNSEPLMQIIDKPNNPIEAERPRKKLIVFSITFLGAFFSVLYVMLAHAYRNQTNN